MMTGATPDIDINGRYSISQASRLLSLSRQTLWRYVKEGKLKGVISKKSDRIKYSGKDLLHLWRTM